MRNAKNLSGRATFSARRAVFWRWTSRDRRRFWRWWCFISSTTWSFSAGSRRAHRPAAAGGYWRWARRGRSCFLAGLSLWLGHGTQIRWRSFGNRLVRGGRRRGADHRDHMGRDARRLHLLRHPARHRGGEPSGARFPARTRYRPSWPWRRWPSPRRPSRGPRCSTRGGSGGRACRPCRCVRWITCRWRRGSGRSCWASRWAGWAVARGSGRGSRHGGADGWRGVSPGLGAIRSGSISRTSRC